MRMKFASPVGGVITVYRSQVIRKPWPLGEVREVPAEEAARLLKDHPGSFERIEKVTPKPKPKARSTKK